MDDISLVYNVNLCCICQNPQSLELIKTISTTNINNRTYVEILHSLFSDIVWFDDKLATNLCKPCSIQLDSFADFKRLCLETNERRRLHISKLPSCDQTNEIVIKTEVKPELVVSAELSRPHQCSNCSESFEKKLELRRHEKKVHGSSTPVRKGAKRKSTDVKRKTISKKPRRLKKKVVVDSSDDDFDGDVNGSDGEDGNESESDKTRDNLAEVSSNSLYYKPAPRETTCRICARTLSSTSHLVSHINNVHARRDLYKCTICQAGFRYKEKLNRHVSHHTGARNHICPQCGSKFITSADLRTHMQSHLTVKKYTCDLCEGKGFKTPTALRTHKIIVHSDPSEYRFACTECDKKFPLKCTLISHMARHTSSKKIKCHICPKEFYTNSELKNHLISHTNVRNFKCDLCPEEFKQKQSLDKHKYRIHQIGTITPRRKYPCGFCGRMISSKDKLRRHERTHTGEKPYKCRLCDMRFICRSYIKGHLKGKHEIDVEVVDFDQRAYYEGPTEEDLDDLRTVSHGAKSRK